MKTIILIVVIAFANADPAYYDLEKLDMDEIIENTDEFKRFIDCLLDRGECTKVYSAYKDITAEAVEQKCKRCTPYQKKTYWMFLQGMKAKFPWDYSDYRKMYDPENKYFDDLEAELRKYSIAY